MAAFDNKDLFFDGLDEKGTPEHASRRGEQNPIGRGLASYGASRSFDALESSVREPNTQGLGGGRVPSSKATNAIPELRINVFGGFEVLLDGKPLEDKSLHRQKVKNLAAVLALHMGQELSCDHVAGMFWPDSNGKKQRHNFYNVWSYLHQALTLESKECPYLVRHQNSCKMVRAYASSDAYEVARLCDALQYLDFNAPEALECYRRLQEAYRGDLLPGEEKLPVILGERGRWRDRVHEAIKTAALSFHKRSQNQTALLFAKAADRFMPFQEDVCQLMLRILIDVGNNAEAVRVYLELRDYLVNEFGLDPSPMTVELYNEIIRDDSSGAASWLH